MPYSLVSSKPLDAATRFPHPRQWVLDVHVAGAQQLVQELRVNLGADLHSAHPSADLLHTNHFGHDLDQRIHVRLKTAGPAAS